MAADELHRVARAWNAFDSCQAHLPIGVCLGSRDCSLYFTGVAQHLDGSSIARHYWHSVS